MSCLPKSNDRLHSIAERSTIVTTHNSASNSEGHRGPAQSGNEAEIKGYGVSVRIPLPRWAVTALAALIVMSLVGSGAYLALTHLVNRVPVPRELLNEYQENNKHSTEPAEQLQQTVFTFPDSTRVTVFHHTSDGCDQVVRWIQAKQHGDGKWIFGPGLSPEKQALAAVAETANRMATVRVVPPPSGVLAPQSKAFSLLSRLLFPSVEASGQGPGHCIDPHPGQFREQGQPAGQCLTKVWRYFADGCYHYQMYNPCAGTWDVWPNGAPHVYWQKCIH
jgi:hypothetical protein